MAEQPPTQPTPPPRRPKRVSLKGRGADIFFGDYTPGLEADPTNTPGNTSTLANKHATEQEDHHDDMPSCLHDGKPESHHESTQAAEGVKGLAGAPAAPSDSLTTGAVPNHAGLARTPASRSARSERRPAAPPPTLHAELPPDLWAQLDAQATIPNTFRYTEDELTALTDALYQISKEQKARITKQDVARLGLNFVLDDYRRRGRESLLGQLAENRQHTRKTGGH